MMAAVAEAIAARYADSRTTRGKDVAIATLVLALLGWGFATLLAASFTNVLKRE